MKRIVRKLVVFLVLTLLVTFAASCTAENGEKHGKGVNIKIGTLKGPTGIGMAQLMEQNSKQETYNTYDFYLAGAPEEITSKIISGELDIAAVPVNLGAVLYQKTEKQIKLAAVNTIGGLIILEKGNTINSVEDLKGKTLMTTGKGATPEYILNYILEANGIKEDVTVEYKTEHSELAALAIAGSADLIMLPEPFVTNVLMKNDEFRIAMNITDLWKDACEIQGKPNALMAMGGVIVREDFLEKNKEAFDQFMTEYETSIDYINDNISDGAKLVEKYEIIHTAAIAERAIPNCTIVFEHGDNLQEYLVDFLGILHTNNPASIGGELPDEKFYYVK